MYPNAPVFAIDPGNEKSAFVLYEPRHKIVLDKGIVNNPTLLSQVRYMPSPTNLTIEMIHSYGMPVGQSVFDTIKWIGRYLEAYLYTNPEESEDKILVARRDVKLHLCEDSRAKDGNVILSLKNIFGNNGTKKNPNEALGEDGSQGCRMKKDMWQALALAVYYSERVLGVT